jgi:phage terminase large subunit-like protein
LGGKIVAGPHVRNACRRHLRDVEFGSKRGIFFDLAKAEHAFRFFEKGLKLSEGQFENQPFLLAPMQAFIIGSLFGWRRKNGQGVSVRRFRRAYIEMGKGQGKSPLAGGIGLYGMCADGEAGSQIYAAAAKKEQADILFRDAVKMVRQSPLLSAVIKASGGMGKEFNLAHHKSQSFFRPISKEAGKTGSGPRPHFALCDEVHEHPDRSIMDMLERGFKFRQNPLLLMITNSGSDRNSICWEEHEHAVKVCAGTVAPDDVFTYVGEDIDDSTFAYVCALDKGDDPLTDPSCWIKANPMLGVILTEEYIAGVAKQARDMPGKRNGILRLHFCQWTDSDEGWMNREMIDAAMEEFDPYEIHKGKNVCAGVDLSATRDLTAMAFVVKTGMKVLTREDGETVSLPTFDLWIEAWTPKGTLKARSEADKAPYELWVEQGYLKAPPGDRIRMDHVVDHLVKVDAEMTVTGVAYDRYAYEAFKIECEARGLTLDHVVHPQGGKVRAKPEPEKIEAAKAAGVEPPQGLWMPGSISLFEDAILDGRLRIRKSPLTMTALMGAAFDHDALDNRWFVKTKASVRIDPAVAAAMAIGLSNENSVVKKEKAYQLIII